MNRILACSALACALSFPPAAQAADSYTLDPAHTNILWFENHFGFSNPSGKFAHTQGTLTLDEAQPQNSKVNVTIDTTSLTTGSEKFDTHIKSPDFLDAAQFPTAGFASDKVDITDATHAKVTGMLTLHGVTKPVTLNVTLNKIGESPITKKKTAGFSATASLNRSDFGITKYIPGVSDEVKIAIESEATLN